MASEPVKELHALVTGRVQGVFFRQSTHEIASAQSLAGWVRNLADGRVEVLAQGSKPSLERLLEFLRHGPPAARVAEVEHEWREPSEPLSRFEVR